MNKLRLLSAVVGGVPAVILVANFVPQPSDELGGVLWIIVLWIIGWAATGLMHRLLRASIRR